MPGKAPAVVAPPPNQSIAQVFQESQANVAVHRKNANILKKILMKTPPQEFNQDFVRLLNMVISIKKKEPSVEKVLKFVIFFVKFIQEKDEAAAGASENGSRLLAFVDFLLRYLLQGVEAKDKAVRFRACQLIAMIMDSIEEVDDNLWQSIKIRLIQRLQDKEAAVRTQAVYALARLQGCEDPEEDADDPSLPKDPIVAKFVQLLQQDTSSDVRKAVLFNIEISEETLPYIIERARDADAGIRKHIYKKSMGDIDFAALSIETREDLLKNGLRDRDLGVRKACTQMLCENWLKKSDSNLLVFLTRLDVMGNSEIAEETLKAIFEANSNLPFSFDDQYWESLTPESVVLMRSFCEHIAQKKDASNLDELIPEISQFCVYLRSYYEKMCDSEDDEERDIYEFVVEQLLVFARTFDFSDEVGRRTMFTMLRDLFASISLPEGFVSKMVDIMYQISQDEAEFTRVMTEMISDVRMPIEASEKPAQREQDSAQERQRQLALAKIKVTLQELSDQKEKATRLEDFNEAALVKRRIQETQREMENLLNQSTEETPEMLEMTMVSNESDATILKSLMIAECLLKRTNDSLAENPVLCGLLRDLVLANIRHENSDIQFAVLRCLGLCCILDKNLAKQNVSLFLECLKEEEGDVKVILQTVFDMGVTFGMEHFNNQDDQGNQLVKCAQPFLQHQDPEIQAIAVEGFTKWLLLRSTDSFEVLPDLIVLYFHTSTKANPRASQCLTYFLQAFSFSSLQNQVMMAKTFLDSLSQIFEIPKDEQVVTPLLAAQQLLEWADPGHLMKKEAVIDTEGGHPHVQLALDVLTRGSEESTALQKVLCQVLGKVKIPKQTGQETVKKLQILGEKFMKKIGDKVSVAFVQKFLSSLTTSDSPADSPTETTEDAASEQQEPPRRTLQARRTKSAAQGKTQAKSSRRKVQDEESDEEDEEGEQGEEEEDEEEEDGQQEDEEEDSD